MKNIIFVLIVVGLILKYGLLSNEEGIGDIEVLESPVVMYSTSWCGYCTKARRLMEKRGIDYLEYDIEKSDKAKKEFMKLGGRGTPLLIINGDVVKGFDKARLKKLQNKTSMK